jgi:hypothetical protein
MGSSAVNSGVRLVVSDGTCRPGMGQNSYKCISQCSDFGPVQCLVNQDKIQIYILVGLLPVLLILLLARLLFINPIVIVQLVRHEPVGVLVLDVPVLFPGLIVWLVVLVTDINLSIVLDRSECLSVSEEYVG